MRTTLPVVLYAIVSVFGYDESPWQPVSYDYYHIDLGELGGHHHGLHGVPAPDYGGVFGTKGAIPRDAIVDVINDLGIKILAIHNEHNENNIAISPYGAFSVLAALSEGLQGDAAYEIIHAARIPKDKHVIRVGLRDVHRHLKSYFIPEEGFLAGLTLNLNNVTLRSEYEDVLHFYGFDYSSFNNALYPEPPTTKRPVEGTTLETGLGVSEDSTTITYTQETDAGTTTELLPRAGGPSLSETTTTEPQSTTTILTTNETTSKEEATTIAQQTTTTTFVATETTQSTTEPATTVTTSAAAETTTDKFSTTEVVTLTTSTMQSTTEAITTSMQATTEVSATPAEQSTTEPATSTSTLVQTTTEISTKPPEVSSTIPTETANTKEIPSTTLQTTTQPSETSTPPSESTVVELTSTPGSKTTTATMIETSATAIAETTAMNGNTARTTRQVTMTMEPQDQLTTIDPNQMAQTTGTTSEVTMTMSTEAVTTMGSLDDMTIPLSLNESQGQDEASLENQADMETTTPFVSGTTTPDLQDMPQNIDFNYNYDANNQAQAYDDNMVDNPQDPQGFTSNFKRSARSIVDYVIARFYDDHHQYPAPPQRPQYVPQEPLTFAVYGKYRESGVNFMKYDTVLPYFFVQNLNAWALSFPLDSSKYYLLLLLPLRDDGVDQLICDLRLHGNLRYIVENLRLTHVIATIPSFMLKGYVTLTPALQRLGIRKIFEPRQADFSPMTNVTDIYVTNIEQAVTVTIRNYLDPSAERYKNFRRYPPVHFKADHPFLYFVVDSELHVALMVGKVINPLNSRIR